VTGRGFLPFRARFFSLNTEILDKTVWNRKHLAIVDRFYPSSKTCHVCSAVNAGLTLADRTWSCVCGVLHDRDLNAARNILSEGLKLIPLDAGHAES
jgi:putative transposase